jgi:hypothetical protein
MKNLKSKVKYLAAGIPLLPLVGLAVNPNGLKELLVLDFVSIHAIRYITLGITISYFVYTVFRLIYAEKGQKKFIKISIINFISQNLNFMAAMFGGLSILSKINTLDVNTTTALLTTASLFVIYLTLITYERNLFEESSKKKLENIIKSARKESFVEISTISGIYLLVLIPMLLTSGLEGVLFPAFILVWNYLYTQLFVPYILPEIAK